MDQFFFIPFFPFPLLVCLIPLCLVCIRNKKKGVRYLVFLILFGFYIVTVINALFFPIYIWEGWPANLTWSDTLRTLKDVNLSPFYFLAFSNRPFSMRWVIVDFGLNLLLTIPFGFGIGYFHKPRFLKLCLWAIGTGLTLEGVQLLFKLGFNNYHVVDINDVILNSLGVLIGFVLFLAARRIFVKRPKPQNTAVE